MRIIFKVILLGSIIALFGIVGFANPEPIDIAQSEPGGL